jgi:hypothetical protein
MAETHDVGVVPQVTIDHSVASQNGLSAVVVRRLRELNYIYITVTVGGQGCRCRRSTQQRIEHGIPKQQSVAICLIEGSTCVTGCHSTIALCIDAVRAAL